MLVVFFVNMKAHYSTGSVVAIALIAGILLQNWSLIGFIGIQQVVPTGFFTRTQDAGSITSTHVIQVTRSEWLVV